MKQLSIQDAGFIFQETERTPMHISGVGIYCQKEHPRKSQCAADTLAYMAARIAACPILQKKLMHVPGQLERPYWVLDQQFDISRHVYFHTLDTPGDRTQLDKLLGRLMAEGLDMTIPLWECHIIDGVEGLADVTDGFAILTKVHHSCVDGSAGSNIMMVLHDMAVDAESLFTDAVKEADEVIPSRFELMSNAYRNTLKSGFEQSWQLSKQLPQVGKIANELYQGTRQSGAKLKVPATRFNKTPDTARVFTSIDFNLDEIKSIKNAFSVTVNDVMVAIVAGALRDYLQQLGELPNTSLGAMLPKNIRQDKAKAGRSGNQVGGLMACLHTDISDPVERLKAIHQSTQLAKKFAEEAGTDGIFAYLMGGSLYPRTTQSLTRFMHKNRVMERIGPILCNTIITNVPGPNFELYHHGAKMLSFGGVPPLPDGIGLAHAIYSYHRKISLSVLSCPLMLDDVAAYRSALEVSFQSLKDLA